MGPCSKIWYDRQFIENVGRVTNEVRLCRLKLNQADITQIFELFNHVKSIWFLHCELEIGPEVLFEDVYYQIEMLSIIN